MGSLIDKAYVRPREELESFFPVLRDDAPSKAIALKNWTNHKNRKTVSKKAFSYGENQSFSHFFQVCKMADRRLREQTIFILWLFLCVIRPWKSDYNNFMLCKWRPARPKELEIVDAIAWTNGIGIPDSYGQQTLLRLSRKSILVTSIISILSVGLKQIFEDLEFIGDSVRFRRMLEKGDLITKREFQRKLRISSARMDMLVQEEISSGCLREIKKPCRSVWLIYSQPLKVS
jgi:hypothetical protein